MKKLKPLADDLLVESYQLKVAPLEGGGFVGQLKILARKTGRPSKRITLHQKNLKISKASIKGLKQQVEIDFPISRINHLRKVEQVRLHTEQMLYPGMYVLEIAYKANPHLAIKDLYTLSPAQSWRSFLPCIDEKPSRQATKLKVND